MREDHREDKAQKYAMEHDVVVEGRQVAAEPKPRRAARSQPEISRQQINCDKAREAGLPDRSARQIIANEPQRHCEHTDAGEPESRLGKLARDNEASNEWSCAQYE